MIESHLINKQKNDSRLYFGGVAVCVIHHSIRQVEKEKKKKLNKTWKIKFKVVNLLGLDVEKTFDRRACRIGITYSGCLGV